MQSLLAGITGPPRLVNLDEARLCVLAVGPTAAFREGRACQVETADSDGPLLVSRQILAACAEVRHFCGHYVGLTVRDGLSID
jgi:hypothetical protein